MFSLNELKHFKLEDGYCFESNPSPTDDTQLGILCPLNERISVNFIMEDGTRKQFSDEKFRIRMCCIFDALQNGVFGMDADRYLYRNLIRDLRVLWPLEEELKLSKREGHLPDYNERRKLYFLNKFKNLDIILM